MWAECVKSERHTFASLTEVLLSRDLVRFLPQLQSAGINSAYALESCSRRHFAPQRSLNQCPTLPLSLDLKKLTIGRELPLTGNTMSTGSSLVALWVPAGGTDTIPPLATECDPSLTWQLSLTRGRQVTHSRPSVMH